MSLGERAFICLECSFVQPLPPSGLKWCEQPGCNGELVTYIREDDLRVREYRTTEENVLPEESAERKAYPMCTGLLDYFPAALAYVAKISKIGNDKHNPGEPLHHARGKSMDHDDCIIRHTVDRGRFDAQGVRHSGYRAWRALAALQEELEEAGEAPLARAARLPQDGVCSPSSSSPGLSAA
jgi:hypothetical protein